MTTAFRFGSESRYCTTQSKCPWVILGPSTSSAILLEFNVKWRLGQTPPSRVHFRLPRHLSRVRIARLSIFKTKWNIFYFNTRESLPSIKLKSAFHLGLRTTWPQLVVNSLLPALYHTKAYARSRWFQFKKSVAATRTNVKCKSCPT